MHLVAPARTAMPCPDSQRAHHDLALTLGTFLGCPAGVVQREHSRHHLLWYGQQQVQRLGLVERAEHTAQVLRVTGLEPLLTTGHRPAATLLDQVVKVGVRTMLHYVLSSLDANALN